MPILTKNEAPAKGQKAEFQLDKSALAAIVSDIYFQDSDNWKSVEMIFKSNPGNQRQTVKFDATQTTPLANFFASAKARDVFEIEKIVINDLDGGEFRVNRSELTVAEFDIDMGAAQVAPFSAILKTSQTVLSNNNFTATSTDNGGYASMVYGETAPTLASGKYYKEFTLETFGLGFNSQYFGIRFFTNQPSYFTPSGSSGPNGLLDNEYQIYLQQAVSLFTQEALGTVTNQLLGSTSIVAGDVIGIALDANDPDKGLYFSLNGVFLNSANPATGVGKISIKSFFPSISDSIKSFFFVQNMGLNKWTINQAPLYLPPGYGTI